MATPSESLFTGLSKDLIKEEFDEARKNDIMKMESPHDALLNSQALKEKGNKFLRMKGFRIPLNRYDQSLQCVCVVVLESQNDANVMEEL